MSPGPTLRTLAYLRPGQVVWRLWRRLQAPLFRTGAYGRWGLPDADFPAPMALDRPLWPGDAETGRRILGGVLPLLGHDHPLTPTVDWVLADQPLLRRFTLHYFEWLDHLAAVATPDAATRARGLIADWLSHHHRPDAIAWHPYPLSLRQVAWLRYGAFLGDGAADDFRGHFSRALHRQARHLTRVLEWDVGGNHLIKNLKALVFTGRCLSGWQDAGERALELLETAVDRQVLADGFHYERSPSYHLQVLRDLSEVADLLGDEAPDWLKDAGSRMELALPVVRHGDGGLALFNDGDVGDGASLAPAEHRGTQAAPGPASLPAAGYWRLDSGDTHVILDAGRCCPDDLPAHAHGDALAFEMSVGDQRLVVNCGTYAYQDPTWRNRLRGTACHSTAAVDDMDSAEVHGTFRLGRRPRDVGATFSREKGKQVVAAHHDGYRHLGWRHERRLTLEAGGTVLAGVDTMVPVRARPRGQRLRVRFHLHPDVSVTVDGAAARLQLSESTWRLETPDTGARLEPSAYAPRFYEMRDTNQVVLERSLSRASTTLRWRLRRLSPVAERSP